MELVAEPPATIAGAAALTAYALEYRLSDLSWPDTVADIDFAAALLRSLSATLSGGGRVMKAKRKNGKTDGPPATIGQIAAMEL